MFWILLLASALSIAYQDFKTRLISIWLIVSFASLSITQYLYFNSAYQFLENSIFTTVYFLFSFLILFLYYYVKNKKDERILNNKIGWGDIIIFFVIGFCLEPVSMIYFFTTSFILSIIAQQLFFRASKAIPLAGLMVLFYSLFLLLQ